MMKGTSKTICVISVMILILLFSTKPVSNGDNQGTGQMIGTGDNTVFTTRLGYEGQKASGNHIMSYRAPKAISLDGDVSDEGWNIKPAGWMVMGGEVNLTFWTIYDDSSLYFAFEIPDDTESEMEMIFIALDTENDRGNRPGTDDYEFDVKRDGTFSGKQGNGSKWKPLSNIATMGKMTTDADSWSVEFSIPWAHLNVGPAGGKKMGLYIRAANAGLGHGNLPVQSNLTTPSTWGELELSGEKAKIMEDEKDSPGFELILVLTAVLTCIFINRKSIR
jgi:hypothetical protein